MGTGSEQKVIAKRFSLGTEVPVPFLLGPVSVAGSLSNRGTGVAVAEFYRQGVRSRSGASPFLNWLLERKHDSQGPVTGPWPSERGESATRLVELFQQRREALARGGEREGLRPFVAAWLNLTPDHLERHGDFATYGAVKQRLFARQEETDWGVWNADDPEVSARAAGRGARLEFSRIRPVVEGAYALEGRITLARRGGVEPLMAAQGVRLRGAHNQANVLAALASVLPLEIPPDTLRQVLRDYRGLEHRLEPVETVDGVHFVNDSKATNIAATWVAVVAMEVSDKHPGIQQNPTGDHESGLGGIPGGARRGRGAPRRGCRRGLGSGHRDGRR